MLTYLQQYKTEVGLCPADMVRQSTTQCCGLTFKNWPDKMTSPTFPASKLMYWITQVCSTGSLSGPAGRELVLAGPNRWRPGGNRTQWAEGRKRSEGNGRAAHGVVSPSSEDRCVQITVADVSLASILVELRSHQRVRDGS